MKLKEKISIEEVCGNTFKIKVVESEEYGKAAFTHYMHNHKNGVSQFFKKEAVQHVKRAMEYKFTDEIITNQAAETALQYMLLDFKKDVPFPEPINPKFKFIDLFSGIGGFRIAMQSLGGKCIFSSEWDEQAKKTYEANFGEVPFGDITKEETKKYIPNGFDVLCAGFPCQAFSIAGKRGGFEDTRGTLFFEVAEIIKRKQPKAIFLENVKGLFNHDKGKTLKTILNVLRNDLKYFVPEPKVLNAKDFGVPQNRERILIVGFRNDLEIDSFDYPKPSNQKVTFKDVKEENIVSVKYYLSNTYLNTLINHKKRHESKGNGFGYEIIPDNGTANAVVCGGMGRERNLVYDDRLVDFTPVTHIRGEVNRQGIRKMTPREWARLQGFPDKFIIPVADASAYKQFGNSVAIPAMKATAEKIINKIINPRQMKTKQIELKSKKLYVGLGSTIDFPRWQTFTSAQRMEERLKPDGLVYFEVSSLKEASELARKFITAFNLGSSKWIGGKVLDSSLNSKARVSYNGRVWDHEDWKKAKEIIV